MIKEPKHIISPILSTLFWLLPAFGFAASDTFIAYDNCSSAYYIKNVQNWCSASSQFSNVGGKSSYYDRARCFSDALYVDNDVWFKFKAIGNIANISIIGAVNQKAKGTLEKPQLALYRGNCNILFEVACHSDSYGNNISETFAYDMVIGATYYLRVDGRGSNQGTFQVCINNYNEVPSPSSDCKNAVILCDKSSFTVPSVIGSGKIKENVSFTCLRDEESSAWYKFTCDKPGTFDLELTPINPGDDIDFVLFYLPDGIDDCSKKIPIRCVASGEAPGSDWSSCSGKTGMKTGLWDTEEAPGCDYGDDNFVAGIEMQAGQSFALLIQNYHNTGNGFSVEFGGSGTFEGPKAWFKVSKLKLQLDTTLWVRDVSKFVGGIATWEWNFGEDAKPQGAKKRGAHVVQYKSAGKKSIRLTVETKSGCIVSVVRTITVIEPPKEILKPEPPPEKAEDIVLEKEEDVAIEKDSIPVLTTPPPKETLPEIEPTQKVDIGEEEKPVEESLETRIIRQKWEIKRVGILYFASDSFNITPEHHEVLGEMVALLKASSGAVASVEGHTNNIPHHVYCKELAKKRSESAMNYLMEKGIESTRLTDKAIGKKRLKTDDKSRDGRKRNQRVEILIMYPDD